MAPLCIRPTSAAAATRSTASGVSCGPPLNGLSKRRSRSWVEEHFADPQKLVPDSMMPAYKLTPRDVGDLTSYLFALPE